MAEAEADPFADVTAAPFGVADTLETMVRLPAEPGYCVICSVGDSFTRHLAYVLRIRKWDRGLWAAFKNGTWDKNQHRGKNAPVVLGPCPTHIEAHQALVGQAEPIAGALPDAVVDVGFLDLDYLLLLKWAKKNNFARHGTMVTL